MIFTPKDFEDREGNPASSAAAAKIANEKFKRFIEKLHLEVQKDQAVKRALGVALKQHVKVAELVRK